MNEWKEWNRDEIGKIMRIKGGMKTKYKPIKKG